MIDPLKGSALSWGETTQTSPWIKSFKGFLFFFLKCFFNSDHFGAGDFPLALDKSNFSMQEKPWVMVKSKCAVITLISGLRWRQAAGTELMLCGIHAKSGEVKQKQARLVGSESTHSCWVLVYLMSWGKLCYNENQISLWNASFRYEGITTNTWIMITTNTLEWYEPHTAQCF